MIKSLNRARNWLSKKLWHQTTAFRGQMFKWSNFNETVRVVWTDGAGPHSGWRATVDRGDHNLQLGNGFVDWSEALLLADLYMGENRVIASIAPGGKSQREWLQDELPDHDWMILNPDTLTPRCPRHATS